MCAYLNHPNTAGEAWYSYWLKAHYTFGDEVHCLCLIVQSPMFSYHLVWCWVVEDLIDSPHLSQDCTKSQQVTQHVHPGVQLHGKSRVQWWEYHSSMTAKYCLPTVVKCFYYLPNQSLQIIMYFSHNAANMVCRLIGWVKQLNINGEIHQQRASNNKVVELWTCQTYYTACERKGFLAVSESDSTNTRILYQ